MKLALKRAIMCSLFITIFSVFQLSAQHEIDSLELLLTTELSDTVITKIQFELVDYCLDNNTEKSKYYLSQLEEKLLNSDNSNQLAQLFLLKSVLYRSNGETEEGVKAANKALEYSKNDQDSIYLKAKIYNSLGSLYDDQSNAKAAIKHHLTALRYAERKNNPSQNASILAGIGRVYLYLSEYRKAENYYSKAIKIKQDINEYDEHLGRYYNNLSICYDGEAKYDSSIYYLNKAIQLQDKYNDVSSLVNSYNNKAYTLLLMNNLKEAEISITKAVLLADTMKNGYEVMYPYSTYAEILFAQGNYQKAERMMLKSVQLSKQHNDLYLEKYNLDLLYNIYLSKNDYEKALDYFKQKTQVLDSVNSVRSRKVVEELALEYETEKKNKEIELLEKDKQIQASELKKSNMLRIAFLATSLLMLAILGLLWQRNKNKLKTDKLIQEALERSYEKKLTDAEMQALRAQMNPHFLFNCLNSINSFIIKNEQEKASNYLGKFSKLIRKVLNNSKAAKVSLSDELEALSLYIEMEALRFQDKFKYEITIASEVEADYIEVPPLIIQPYVENSIWHGLMHKTDGTGKLLIDVKQKKDLLICIIEDNGIGREAALKLKSKSAIKRKSYGMSITKERLKYVNSKYKVKTDIEVIDLKNNLSEAIGTKVIIKIGVE